MHYAAFFLSLKAHGDWGKGGGRGARCLSHGAGANEGCGPEPCDLEPLVPAAAAKRSKGLAGFFSSDKGSFLNKSGKTPFLR
jgi:hypothetical protein